MFGEELRRAARERRLAGHGLRAVFAELGDLALTVRIGPGAARTIEAVLLIELEQRLERALDAHRAKTMARRLVDGREARRRQVAPAHARGVLLERWLRAR